MKIGFSKFSDLNVKYNNDKSRYQYLLVEETSLSWSCRIK